VIIYPRLIFELTRQRSGVVAVDQPDLPERCPRNVMKDETKGEAKDARYRIRTFPESGARSNAQHWLVQRYSTCLYTID